MPRPLLDPWFEAHFIGFANVGGRSWHLHPQTQQPITFAEAQGVAFWCPCGIDARDKDGALRYPLDLSLNKGRPHGCLVVFAGRGAPDNFGPHSRSSKDDHPRWQIAGGDSLHNLTLTPSIAIGDPECWHGYITNGDVTP